MAEVSMETNCFKVSFSSNKISDIVFPIFPISDSIQTNLQISKRNGVVLQCVVLLFLKVMIISL
jgi:hypothetical protein